MPAHIKQLIFWSLVSLFLADSAFVYSSGAGDSGPVNNPGELAMTGKMLFQEHNCIACHQIYGLGGYMGPDLTNVQSGKGKDGGPSRAFLRLGTNRMPDFHLKETELDALIAYLKYINKTGRSPVMDFTIQYDGTIRTIPNK